MDCALNGEKGLDDDDMVMVMMTMAMMMAMVMVMMMMTTVHQADYKTCT